MRCMKPELSALQEQISHARQRMIRLRRASEIDPESCQLEVLENLSTALEELNAMAEEWRSQNDELRQAYDDVEQARRRYRELFELAPDPYLVTDHYGLILEANEAAGTMLQRRTKFLLGKPLLPFLAQEAHARFFSL